MECWQTQLFQQLTLFQPFDDNFLKNGFFYLKKKGKKKKNIYMNSLTHYN